MMQRISLRQKVTAQMAGLRLDQAAAKLFPEYSRSRIQEWIRRGELTLSGKQSKPNLKMCGGEELVVLAEPEAQANWQPQALDLDIVYEDEHLLVVNKQAGLVVHPAAGNYEGTLLNGLLHYLPELEVVPRAGIVHRLDKDTTGLMVVAKTLSAQTSLVAQLQQRSVKRIYRALTCGHCPFEGRVEAPIGRDSRDRKKMAVVERGGKEAITTYKVLSRLGYVSLVELSLATGRTHQIRVHMSYLGFPLVGDPLYGKPVKKTLLKDESLRSVINQFPRQALHACQLSLQHPFSLESMSWQVPLPSDLADLVGVLERKSHE